MVNRINKIVKDPNKTMAAKEMVPAGNELVNALTSENVCIVGIKFGKNHKANKTTVVKISAMI